MFGTTSRPVPNKETFMQMKVAENNLPKLNANKENSNTLSLKSKLKKKLITMQREGVFYIKTTNLKGFLFFLFSNINVKTYKQENPVTSDT